MKNILIILLLITFFAYGDPPSVKDMDTFIVTNFEALALQLNGTNGIKQQTKAGVAITEFIMSNKDFEEYVITTSNQGGSIERQETYSRFRGNSGQVGYAVFETDYARGRVSLSSAFSFILTNGADEFQARIEQIYRDKTMNEILDIFDPSKHGGVSATLYITAADGSVLTAPLELPNAPPTAIVKFPFTTTSGETGNFVYDPVNNKFSIEPR